MKECREIRELLSQLVDGEIPVDLRAKVDRHLSVCPSCRSAFNELKQTVALLRGLEPVQPPPWLEGRIMTRVREEAGFRHPVLNRLFGSLRRNLPLQAAALIVLCVTGYYLARMTSPEVELNAPMQESPKETSVERQTPAAAPSPPAEKTLPTETPGGKGRTITKETVPAESSRSPSAPVGTERVQPVPEPREKNAAGEQRIARKLEEPRLKALEERQTAKAVDGSPQPPRVEAPVAVPINRGKPSSLETPAPAGAVGGALRDEYAFSKRSYRVQKSKRVAAPATTLAITIEADDPASAGKDLARAVKEVGGIVTNGGEGAAGRLLEARIEASRMPEFLKKLERLGKLQSKDLSPPDRQGAVQVSVTW
jgi:hypothetical protein